MSWFAIQQNPRILMKEKCGNFLKGGEIHFSSQELFLIIILAEKKKLDGIIKLRDMKSK